ncbi:MAG: efflux RND transporter periplasmic adaptor subunit [Myxococcota bacterium]
MKSTYKKALIGIGGLAVIALAAIGFSLNSHPSKSEEPTHQASVQVSKNGAEIIFTEHHPGLEQFKIETVTKQSSVLRIKAPAQVVASFQNQGILFSQPEASSLYSEYLQSLANFEKSQKNEARSNEMFKYQAATAKDLGEAKTEALNARSIKSDLEARLKSLGLDPIELKKEKSGKIWLLAEVPENQLHEVEKGEEVKTTLISYPGQTFLGHVAAIGEVIDPGTRTVKVRVTLDGAKDLLKPGMFAECDFGVPEQDAIVLPSTAIVTVEEKNFIFVKKSDHQFERRPVSIANSTEQASVISSGLAPGEQVVTTGAIFLKGLSFGY